MGGVGITLSNRTSLKERAVVRRRRGAWLWWSWLASGAILYVLHEHLELVPPDVARIWVWLLIVLAAIGAAWLYKIRGNDCHACEFVDVQSDWKYCPGCGIATDLSDVERKNVPRPTRSSSIGALYRATRLDTTRKRAKRWRLANVIGLLSVFIFVFGMFPLYFVGPWVDILAPRWWWFMLGGMLPFLAVHIAALGYGLRCVQCNAKLGVNAREFSIASTTLGKHHWAFCPHCAHSLDAPYLENRCE